MDIVSVRHKGLRDLLERNDPKGLPAQKLKRIRNILTALVLAEDMDRLTGPPGWRIHELKGNRAGFWSISISGNWRLTFRIEDDHIADLDLEDYH